MTDRPSSSRSPQGDRSSNRFRQDSPGQRTRDRNVIEWILGRHNRLADQQASTSRGLDNDTSDKWQENFQVLLDDYRFCLNDILKESKEIQDEIIEEYKQEFEQVNGSERKEYIKNLKSFVRGLQPDKFQDNEQIAIDEELGYFLKRKHEKLKDVRKEAIKFLAKKIEKKIENGIEKKIKKKSDRRVEFSKWAHALDEYCLFNQNQRVIDTAYKSVADDMKLIYEFDLEEIKNAEEKDFYKDDNEEIYRTIEKINLSLYSAQDREALRQQEIIEAEREWQNLANRGQESDDERSHSSSDSHHEGMRNTIISSDDEEIRNTSFEQSQMEHETEQSLEQSQIESAIQQSLEQLQMEQVIQQSLEQSNPNSQRDLEGTATLIRARLQQIFERFRQIVQSYYLEHDHRPQSQERQSFEQRYEVIDVSHMASPQIINLDEVLRQQLQSMWRRMLRSDA